MRGRALRILLAAGVAAWLGGCSSSDGSGDGGGGDGSDGARAAGGDGADLPSDQGGGDGQGGDFPICDKVNLKASSTVNLLLVVDKSNSMNDPTSASNPGRTKAEDLCDALTLLLQRYGNRIRFGWMAFPYQAGNCDPGQVSVPVGDGTAGLIQQLVDAFIAWGATPTGESLQNAAAHPGLQDTERSNYVMLITDGMPTCPNGNGFENEADNQLALQAVQQLSAAGIETFVIGLGDDLNASNPQLLNDMAVAGGHPRTGNVKYHPAGSLDELTAAFDEIARTVFECSLELGVWPEQPDFIWVYFDGDPVPRDRGHQDGFDYDDGNNRIDFYGPSCDKLLDGQVGEVLVEMGCSPPT